MHRRASAETASGIGRNNLRMKQKTVWCAPAGIEPATLSLEFGPTKRALEVQDPWCAEYGNVNPFHAPRITRALSFHIP